MAEAERITARQRAILTAIVENYIETGEPVGSGTIAGTIARVRAGGGHAAGLSSATVRNEMAELANEGLLEQPHTSAGRVPTARAFRMYVERLSERTGPRLLGGAQRSNLESQRLNLESQIDTSFAGITGTQAMLERTSHVLATVSSGVGVAVAMVSSGDTLEHVHFSRLAKGSVLAVVVTSSGLVRDRMLTMGVDVTARELMAAANFLNEHFRGWSIERVRTEIGRLVEREQSEVQRLLTSVEAAVGGRRSPGRGRADRVCGGSGEPTGRARSGQRGRYGPAARGAGGAGGEAAAGGAAGCLHRCETGVGAGDLRPGGTCAGDGRAGADCGAGAHGWRWARNGGRDRAKTHPLPEHHERGELYRAGLRADAASSGVRAGFILN